MNLPALVDVGLGLAVVFFLLATIGSIVVELIAGYARWRHKELQRTIAHLVGSPYDKKNRRQGPFWEHPVIAPLGTLDKDGPGYLASDRFAAAAVDLALGSDTTSSVPPSREAIRVLVRQHGAPLPKLRDAMLGLLRNVPADDPNPLATLRTAVAHWYDEAMQRTTGAYKRKVQTALFVTGLIAAALLNVDAVRITQILYRDPDIRKAAADFAVETARSHPAPAAQPAPGGQPAPTPQPATAAQAASATPLAPTAMPGTNSELSTTEARQQLSGEIRQLRELTRIGFPIGWVTPRYMNFVPVTVDPAQRTDAWKEVAILSKLLGLLATAFAVCLGAPFWFDILNKLVKLRSSGGSDAKSSNPSAPDAAAGAASGAPAGFPPGGSAPATAPLGTAAALAAVPRAEPPEFGAALAVPSVAFSTAKALRLAEASRLAYDKPLQGDDKEKDDTFVTYAKENWLAKSQTLLTDAATGTEVGVALLGDVAVIACRGTEPDKIKDWQTDASCVLKAAAADPAKSLPAFPGLIHTGFHEAFCAVYPKIKAWLAAFPEKDRTFVLYVTGHSLGAAIGTLVAYQLEQERFHRVQGVYTYGSPRVGNPAFASGYAALLGDRTYRVVNNEDLVTRVPPTLPAKLDYKHVGEMVYIDDAGRLQRDIGFWYRALNFTENAVRLGVLDAVKVTAGDHDMLKYIAWLKQAARTQPAV